MAGEDEASKFEDFDARMRRLRGEVGLSRDQPEVGAGARPSIGGTGVQVGVELVAGVFGGALIGYGLDRWLETWPIFFLVLFFLGAAAGMLNAYRHIRRLSDVPEERSNDR
jgi:ATP synthase protein I